MLITGEGNGNPLQYSCLENSVDRGACWATVHGVTRGGTWLNDWAQHMLITYTVHSYHIVYPSPRVHLSVWRCLLIMNSKYTISTLYIGEGNGTPLHYPCLENPTCGLQSIWSQRVRHDWSDLACTHTLYALYTTTHKIQLSHIK